MVGDTYGDITALIEATDDAVAVLPVLAHRP
jgi:hypothetical protein